MINLGNIEISDIRLGESQVKAVYFGSELVWGGEEPAPAAEPLCFTALEAGSTVAMIAEGEAPTVSLEYSTDGNTWSPFVVGTTTVTIANIGDKMYMRATSAGNTGMSSSSSDYNKFVMTGKIAASGNVDTLLDQNGNATLTNYCYLNMFSNCTSLTQAPELPATTLADNCYRYMFNGCTSLTQAPELPATTLANNCYKGMFLNCTALTTAPELPATTLAIGCYENMFQACSLLTTAPELPATTLANNCYKGMFYSCTSLTQAPELPATTLANNCYLAMFGGCSSLTQAPELPATTLANYCYFSMFYSCTSLSSLKVAFTAWYPTNATTNWVSGVAASGTFTCPAELPDTRGTSNIPEGWTKVDASLEIFYNEAPTKVYYYDDTSAEYNIVGEANTSNVLSASSVQKIEFGNTVSSIAKSLFRNSTKLQYVYTGWNCEVINDRSFNDITSLNTVVFGPGIKCIGNPAKATQNYSFAGSGPISSVMFHDDSQLSAVKYGAMFNAISCDELVIKSRASSLDFADWALASDKQTKKVKVFVFDVDVIPTCTDRSTLGSFAGQGFVNGESGCYAVVPDSLVTAWKATSPWSNWSSNIISMTEYEAIKNNS